jgi:hypothetical protein
VTGHEANEAALHAAVSRDEEPTLIDEEACSQRSLARDRIPVLETRMAVELSEGHNAFAHRAWYG